MKYRCEALSVGGFIQQLVTGYLCRGYLLYVPGIIPAQKDPKQIDEKLIKKYGIALSKFQRYRRTQNGEAGVQYLRYQHDFLLLATVGDHHLFEEEAKVIHDIRRSSIKFHGYSISLINGHPVVRIAGRVLEEIEAYFLSIAVHRIADTLADEFYKLPYEPYIGVRTQLLNILQQVNEKRKKMGYKRVSASCLRWRRNIYRPFDSPHPRRWNGNSSQHLISDNK